MKPDHFWMQTATGRQFFHEKATAEDICIEDIAHALSHLCRFGGHCRDFYSVAEHSVRVAEAIEDEGGSRIEVAAGLMHDAAEAYVGDMVWPLKQAMPDFRAVEERIERAIADKFGLPHPLPEIVKKFDLVLLATEKRDLMQCVGGGHIARELSEARSRLGRWASDAYEPLPRPIDRTLSPHPARRRFMLAFEHFVAGAR